MSWALPCVSAWLKWLCQDAGDWVFPKQQCSLPTTLFISFFPLWKGCSLSAGNKAECCSIASTADQAFLRVLKGKWKGKKYTSLDCVTKMASHIIISQQDLAQVDKAAARILEASWYCLCWGSSKELLLSQINTESVSVFGSSKTLFSVIKKTTINCACLLGQGRR